MSREQYEKDIEMGSTFIKICFDFLDVTQNQTQINLKILKGIYYLVLNKTLSNGLMMLLGFPIIPQLLELYNGPTFPEVLQFTPG